MLRSYRTWTDGGLGIVAGGQWDQPAWYVEAMDLVRAIETEWHEREARRVERERESMMRRARLSRQ